MKAISLWQPWASLWACGRKTYETRHWATSYRGYLLVHAARTICIDDIGDELREICEDEFGGHWAVDLPRGALIAHCMLVNCIPTEQVKVDRDERAQGNFAPGRFAWDPSNMKMLDAAIICRGRQGLFDVSHEVIGHLAMALLQASLL